MQDKQAHVRKAYRLALTSLSEINTRLNEYKNKCKLRLNMKRFIVKQIETN